MLAVQPSRVWWATQVLLALLVLLSSSVSADDDPQAKRRLRLMEKALGKLEPESSQLKTKPTLTFASKPLLRYSDPTRGVIGTGTNTVLLDGSVWRLGTEGRPTALVTIELYGVSDTPDRLVYEFLALTKTKFSIKHKEERINPWKPTESGLTLKELPEAPKPAATAAARLAQMRQLARRFAAKERIRKEEIACRLLTQPIDRYQSKVDKIVDGAIFVHVNSTNPEVGIVIETDGNRWVYGTLRLAGAALTIALDGREVATYKAAISGSYQYRAHGIIDTDK